MDRRHFLGLATGALIAGASAEVSAQSSGSRQQEDKFTQPRTGEGLFHQTRQGKQPHIFFITADMVSPDLYHPQRPFSRLVKLPAIHSLASNGTFFSNAYCTVPLCSPSRASYLTGRYSYIQGNGERAPVGLETQLRPTDIIFPEYLRAAGYTTRQIGKAHVGTTKFLDAFGENDQPWDRWSPPVFDDDAFIAYRRKLGVKAQKYSREIVFRQQDRATAGNSVGGWIVQDDGSPYPLEAHYSVFQARCAIETLRNMVVADEPPRHPIYLQLDFFDPHQPFSIPAGFEERERELRKVMSLPSSYEAARRDDFQRHASEPEILDIYRRYWGIYDPGTLLDYRIAYALQMEIVDYAIGLFLSELNRLGLYDNAIVAFISDHGEMNGRRALVDKGVYLHPDVLRVPIVIKPPQGRAQTVNDAVSLLDISQTFLDAAGIRPEAMFDGVSLLAVLSGGHVPERDDLLFFGGWHVGVNFACGIEHRMPDDRRFLYVYNCTSAQDELYDLDSEDAVNLSGNPAYRDIRLQMLRALGQRLQSDPRWFGYWAEFRIAHNNELPRSAGDMQLFAKPQ
jgi:arylsulfatase A-like enzyme